MAENFVNIIRDIRGSTNEPATDTSCIYGDIKKMHKEYQEFNQIADEERLKTDEERLKLENIEEGATKNSTDGFLLSRENHTGNMSIANVQDTPSRMAMTIHEKNKLEAIDEGATRNATDAELRSRSTHTGTQSADTIVDGLVNAAYTLEEKNKLSVLSTTVPPAHTHDNTSIMSLSYSKLTGVPETFYPSEHLHSMNEITTGNLDATRINQTNSLQFVNSIEKEKIAISETTDNKGIPFGYAPLDGNGKINPSYLDSLNVIDVFTPINQESMLLLTSAKPGDIAYVQDSQNTYMLVALPVHLQDNWKQMNTGSGVVTFNGLSGVVSVVTDEIPEGSANVYFTNERVDDRVANLLAPGANVSMVYNDDTNQIIISANDTSVEWSEIQNKPNTEIDVNLSGDISGSGSVTLSQLGNGALNIANMTLESVGAAGTYTKVTTNTKGQVVSGGSLTANDIPNLDASKITSGIIDAARLPAYVDDVLEYPTLSGFPVTGETGKIYIALDTNKAYRWSGSTYVYITSGAVDSVAGKTGVVTLVKADVGLANVDNTSDANKPISTATQTALNLKANLASPALTGTPTAPTASVGTNTTQLATTAFVQAEIANDTYNKADVDAMVVHKTGNETIAGIKTFSSSPIVPTPTIGTQAVNKDYADTKVDKVVSTDNAIARYDGTTGKLQNSGVVIDDNNNVGIGGTPSAWAYKTLQINGCHITSNGLAHSEIGMNTGYSGGNDVYLGTGVSAVKYIQKYDGAHLWQTAPSGTAGQPITWTNAMTLGSNGNLLVGTSVDNGTDKLQVNGTVSSGAVQIVVNGDLNDYKTRTQVLGTYTSGYVSNIPINDHGYLEVIVYSPDVWVMQRFTSLGVTGAPGRVFVRFLVNGVWSDWVEK